MSEKVKLNIYGSEMGFVNVGDVVTTTTSDFEFDMISATFCRETVWVATVEAEHIGEDYSEFNERKCFNGGAYGFDYFKVTSIIEEADFCEDNREYEEIRRNL